jgi:P-type Ca2+ transporter type 2C
MNTSDDRLFEKWWTKPSSALLEQLGSDPDRGLSADRVAAMRERYGANEMRASERASLRDLLWESITSPMMLLLLAVAGLSLLLAQYREAVVMAAVVLIYVGVELYNKARTERTMDRLRELQAPKITVMRKGGRQDIEVSEVVVGDVLVLQPGTRIAADARLLSAAGLLIDEAPLTGESTPQTKDPEANVASDAELAERPTAVFAGTTVLDGQGKALVMAVGDRTELGQMAALTAAAEEVPTPLQQEMQNLAQTLVYVALGVSLLIPLAGFLRGFDLEQMVLTWLSLTFLMVPGQPPIIITMALALAAFELARKHVIVSRLRGAETLGSVTVILSDKTGTMTQNDMALTSVVMADGRVIDWDARDLHAGVWQTFLHHAAPALPAHSWNPTDRAVAEALRALDSSMTPEPGQLVDQVGFARGEVYRSMTYEQEDKVRTYVTGSPAFIIERANRWNPVDRELQPWDDEDKRTVEERITTFAGEGKRITAYAYDDSAETDDPQTLIFVGCAVLEDPLRPEVPAAIQRLREAGVRTALVTGDNEATARYVAEQVGLDASRVMTGKDLTSLSKDELEGAAREVDVFARTTPEQKLNLVQALQRQDEVVAVTGDGVNDAPALRTGHVGVAMGATGTDVAREAAEIVLTDDDFSHLPDGVAIGRKAYENFRKGITYYLSAKAILLTAFLLPLIVGEPFPFAPIQIIAIELLMDLASSTIFISEEAEPGLMAQGPRRRRRYLSWEVGLRILRNTVGPAAAILVSYFVSLALGYGVQSGRTAAFATWLLGHIVLALNLKQETVPLLKQGLLSNRFGAGWLAGMIALVLLMTQVPFVQQVLQTTDLTGVQWLWVVLGALLGSMWLEILKWLRR